jgi:Uma2 family endonuclease
MMSLTIDKPNSFVESKDQRVVTHGSWEAFKLIQQGFCHSSQVRLFYCEGTIEILMPGKFHEVFSEIIGSLLGLFLMKQGIAFLATGSMTQEKEQEASLQADKSYCIGESKLIPDLAIEVVFSSGGPNKLARYKAIGTSEVWFWEDGSLVIYHLSGDDYQKVDRSQLAGLGDLDLELFKRCILIGESDTGEAMRCFLEALVVSQS